MVGKRPWNFASTKYSIPITAYLIFSTSDWYHAWCSYYLKHATLLLFFYLSRFFLRKMGRKSWNEVPVLRLFSRLKWWILFTNLTRKKYESGFPYCFLTNFTKCFHWESMMLDFGCLTNWKFFQFEDLKILISR